MTLIKKLIFILLFPLPTSIIANDKVVNVYNWANYLPSSVIQQFQKETGIHVNYMEYDSNETMYAKIKADPHVGFDVIVPSSYYVERMRSEHMLTQLDLSKIPNAKFLNPALLNRPYDPHNLHSLPYAWGVTGIVVNDKYFDPKSLSHWSDLWNKKYKNQLLMLNDMREVFSIALITLNYSVNDTNPAHIYEAYKKLRTLLPNVKLFSSDAEQNIYVDEDATLGMGWSGDIFQARQENKNIQFVFPKDHFVLWIDSVAIPQYAPHLANAYKFINFINRPNISAKIAQYNGYSSPNLAAINLLPPEYKNSPILNPTAETLKRATMNAGVGSAEPIYEKYWQLLKLG